MRIGVLKTRGLATLLAGLASLLYLSGQEPKAPSSQRDLTFQAMLLEMAGDADMLGGGKEAQKNYAEAVRLYRKAAELGDVVAQRSLGTIYYEGKKVRQDYAEAVSWCHRAAEQGDPQAQFLLGIMYYQGQGVTQDHIEAHMWLNLAASRANGAAQKKYADARELVASTMAPQQITEAQRRAREWKPKTEAAKPKAPKP